MAQRQLFQAAYRGSGLLAASLALAPAQAQDQDPKTWYVGASTGDTNVEVYRGFGWEVGGSERGFNVRGGLQFHRNFELELTALRATDLRWSEYFSNTPGYLTAHTTFDVTALQANAVGKVHWGEAFEGYLKVGLVQYQVGGRQVLDTLQTDAALTRDVDETGWDHLLGIGLAIKASPKVRVRIEYGYFGLDRDFLGVGSSDDPTIDTFAIGLDYQLNPRKTTVNSLQ
jgi:opacity protein-like surface antigen